MAISLSGSLEITGSINATGGITGSFSGTATSASYALVATSASYANNATTSSFALVATSASYAANADLLDGRDSLTFANTGSNSFVGSQNINGSVAITGSLTTTGAITAQTLNVQQVTSSIVYSSGSNIFGNSISNTQSMTGSVGITGSLSVNGNITGSIIKANELIDVSANTTNVTTFGSIGYNGSIGSFWRTKAGAFADFAFIRESGAYVLRNAVGTDNLYAAGDLNITGALNGTSATFTGTSGAHIGVTSTVTDATGSSRFRATATGSNIVDMTVYSASHASRANQAWIGGDGSTTVTVLQAAGVEFLRGTSAGAVTLTGALSGTSATFSAQVGITTTSTTPALQITLPGNANATILQSTGSNSGYGWKLQQEEVSTGDFRIFRREASVDYQVLNLARSTGAATFSSSVTANVITSTSSASSQLFLKSTGGGSNRDWQFQTSETAAGDLSIMQSTTAGGATYATKLNIGATGAATFSGNLSCSGAAIQLNQTELIASTGASNRAYALGIGNVAAGDFVIMQGSTATGGTYTPRLTINPTGNVGIGTTVPTSPLTIAKTLSANQTYLNFDNVTNTKYNWGINWSVLGATNINVAKIEAIYPSDDNIGLAFSTYGSGGLGERVRINKEGNVGIGTTSPGAKLAVQNIGASVTGLLLANNNATTGDYNQIKFQHSQTDTSFGVAIRQITVNGAAHGGTLAFLTDNTSGTLTEAMRITSGGTVQITNAGDAVLQLTASGSTAYVRFTNSAGDIWGLGNAFTGAYTNFELYNFTTATYGFKILRGGIYATTATSPRSVYVQSDGTLGGISSIRESKININSLDSSWLMQLNPVSFNYRKKDTEDKYTDEHYDELFYGLIAEEVESINKEICTYNDDKLSGIEYSKLVPVLVKAVQEQQAQIESQQAQIEALKLLIK